MANVCAERKHKLTHRFGQPQLMVFYSGKNHHKLKWKLKLQDTSLRFLRHQDNTTVDWQLSITLSNSVRSSKGACSAGHSIHNIQTCQNVLFEMWVYQPQTENLMKVTSRSIANQHFLVWNLPLKFKICKHCLVHTPHSFPTAVPLQFPHTWILLSFPTYMYTHTYAEPKCRRLN